MSDPRIEEQKRYYRARAPEYDDWWYRLGRYDLGDAHRRAWQAEALEVRRRVEAELLPVGGALLELAAGTGTWTEVLMGGVAEIVAVDASAEVLAINRDKCASLASPGSVSHVEADIFGLDLGRRFEAVFFGFWLTHVPDDRFDEFWVTVDRHLAPGGRVFLIDNAHPEGSGGERRADGIHASSAGTSRNDVAAGTAIRTLADGSSFEIVKRFWHPGELVGRLAELGWRADAATTDRFFLHALVERA